MASTLDPGFVEVVVKATGEKHVIPEHWLDHEVLSQPFTLPPSAKADKPKTSRPATGTGNQDPDATPAPAETPAAGD